MLNPRWHTFDYNKDLRDWQALEASGHMFLAPQMQKLNLLLDRYFVSKSGYRLGPGYSSYQKLEILRKTMDELEYTIPYYEQKKVDDWHAQRDLEEDPNAKSLREEEMEKTRREGSVPNPLRQNYDYSNEMGGPEWQNRVKKYRDLIRKKKEALHGKRERDRKDM